MSRRRVPHISTVLLKVSSCCQPSSQSRGFCNRSCINKAEFKAEWRKVNLLCSPWIGVYRYSYVFQMLLKCFYSTKVMGQTTIPLLLCIEIHAGSWVVSLRTLRFLIGPYEKLMKHFFLGNDYYLCCTWPTGQTPICMLHIDIRLIIKLQNSGNHWIDVINSVIAHISSQTLTQLLPLLSPLLISTERIIEDHESVMEVLSGWGMDTDSRLYFRKNYAKYEFFRKPLVSAGPPVFLLLLPWSSQCALL